MALTKATMEARERRFAALIARGSSQADALRIIKPKLRNKPSEYVVRKACQFAARGNVRAMIDEALRQAGAADLMPIGKWAADTVLLREKALEAGNHNAAQGYTRQLGQFCGALKDNIVINQYDKADDAAVIERLAKGDPAVAAMLTKVIGKADFDS